MIPVVITSLITGTVVKLALIGAGVRLAPPLLARLQVAAQRQPRQETRKDPETAQDGTPAADGSVPSGSVT